MTSYKAQDMSADTPSDGAILWPIDATTGDLIDIGWSCMDLIDPPRYMDCCEHDDEPPGSVKR